MKKLLLMLLLVALGFSGCAPMLSSRISEDISGVDTPHKLSWLVWRSDYIVGPDREKEYDPATYFLRTLDFASGMTMDTPIDPSIADPALVFSNSAPYAVIECPEMYGESADGWSLSEYDVLYADENRPLGLLEGKLITGDDFDCDVLAWHPSGRAAGFVPEGEKMILGTEEPGGAWNPLIEVGESCSVKEISHICWESETSLLMGLRTGKQARYELYRCNTAERSLEKLTDRRGKTLFLLGSGLAFDESMTLSPDCKYIAYRISDSDYPGSLESELILVVMDLQTGEHSRVFRIGNVGDERSGSFQDKAHDWDIQIWH